MQELIKQIEQWGKDRKIDKCNPLLQTTKTLEEIIELQQAIIMLEDESKCIDCQYHKKKMVLPDEYECGRKVVWDKSILCTYEDDIKDAIGDIFITLVMLGINNRQYNSYYLYKNVCEELYPSPDFGFNTFEYSIFTIKSIYEYQFQQNIHNVREIIVALLNICEKYSFNLKECVEYAYNQIKDRKGKIVNGLWQKERV